MTFTFNMIWTETIEVTKGVIRNQMPEKAMVRRKVGKGQT